MRNGYRMLAAAITAALMGAAQAQSDYVKRVEPRFGAFAGSSGNLESLASGLRSGTEVTLTGSGEKASFTPPTKPMGYGNVTRSLDLANRQLAALGVTEPTPSEISASLMGGTVRTAQGDVTLQGVLQLRSEGMGWGQVAHTIGVHPGLGSGKAATPPPPSGAGITTALGRPAAVTGARPASGASAGSRGQGNAHGHSASITTAAGAASHGQGKALGGSRSNGKN